MYNNKWPSLSLTYVVGSRTRSSENTFNSFINTKNIIISTLFSLPTSRRNDHLLDFQTSIKISLILCLASSTIITLLIQAHWFLRLLKLDFFRQNTSDFVMKYQTHSFSSPTSLQALYLFRHYFFLHAFHVSKPAAHSLVKFYIETISFAATRFCLFDIFNEII